MGIPLYVPNRGGWAIRWRMRAGRVPSPSSFYEFGGTEGADHRGRGREIGGDIETT